MDEVPAQYKTVGVLQLVCGLVNVMMGWGIAYLFWTIAGGLVTTVCTLGMCPIGFLCGFAGFLVIPLGAIEAITGILTLANPQSARQLNKYLPLIQIPSILLGNFVSPILGGIAFFLLRDPEVAAYIEGY